MLKETCSDLFVQSYSLLRSRALLVKVMDGNSLFHFPSYILFSLPLHDETLLETANIIFPVGR